MPVEKIRVTFEITKEQIEQLVKLLNAAMIFVPAAAKSLIKYVLSVLAAAQQEDKNGKA